MTFADARACLSCRGAIDEGVSTCPHCGLDLRSTEIQQAWRALVVADQWVARARELATAPASHATHKASAPIHQPRRRLSAGTVLLILGAVSLLVAGLIFITVSWGSMGIVGRALALLAFTAVVGVVAQLLTRRGLRGSVEALWSVFLGLLTLDWFAARDQGLFGLDALPGGYAAGVWGLVILIAGIAIARSGRGTLGKTLVAPALAAGSAPLIGAGGVVGEISGEPFWWALSTAVVAALVTLLHRRLALRPAEVVALVGTAVLSAFAVIAAFVQATDHSSLRALVLDGQGLPLLVVAVVSGAVGFATKNAVRSVAATVSALAMAALVASPADAEWPMRGAFVVASAVVVVCAWVGTKTGAGRTGLRWAGGITAAAAAIGAFPYVTRLIDMVLDGAFGERSTALTARVDAGPGAADLGPWWVPVVVATGLAVGLRLAGRWPELAGGRRHLWAAAASTLALGVAVAMAIPAPPVVSLGGSLVLIGGLLAFANRMAPVGWRHLGLTVVALAPIATFSSWPASLVVWPLAVLVLALEEWHESDEVVRWSGRGFAAWWASLVPGVVMAYLGHSGRPMTLAIIGGAAVVLLLGATVLDRRRVVAPIDLGAAAAGAIGLILGTSGGLDALPWTLAGAGVTVAGLLNRRRRWCRWVGPGLLGVAYVVRLADIGVDVVEAYTAPFAVAVSAAGLWAMRNGGAGSLRALGPGVTLALLPSLPQALDEPTSLRALVLGIVALVVMGAGLARRWRAPFIGGAAVLLLLVVANIGPWALALPRWMLIAAVGAAAIGIGATWESRVRNGKAAASYVSAMR